VPKRIAVFAVLLVLLTILTPPAFAQDGLPAEPVNFAPLLPVALTLLLPIGMILLVSSAMPPTKAPATAINLLVVWAVAALAYFLVGFAFQFGGVAQVSPRPDLSGLYWEWYPLDQSVDVNVARLWGVVALRGWALAGQAITPGALRLFLTHVSLVGVAAMIPAGVLLQRSRGITAILAGLLAGTLVYPLAGNWLWGGGWLSHLGSSLGLGHGVVDFGGAGVIFLTGSGVALVALILFRLTPTASDEASTDAEVVLVEADSQRLTVYDEPADSQETTSPLEPVPMPSAYLPVLSLLGGGLVLLGWMGLSTGAHAPTAQNFVPAQAAVSGLLAALAGALAAAGYSWFTTQELNPLMTARGLVAGLVVAAAGAPFIPIWMFVVAGLVMGLLLPLLIYLFNQGMRLADETGALATFGVSAAASLLLVALFAGGQAGQGWNNVGPTEYLGVSGQGVTGLLAASGFTPDWPAQLQAQLLGLAVILVWTLLVSFLLFQTVITVADAWTRTGWELAKPWQPPAEAATPSTADEPAEDSADAQIPT